MQMAPFLRLEVSKSLLTKIDDILLDCVEHLECITDWYALLIDTTMFCADWSLSFTHSLNLQDIFALSTLGSVKGTLLTAALAVRACMAC